MLLTIINLYLALFIIAVYHIRLSRLQKRIHQQQMSALQWLYQSAAQENAAMSGPNHWAVALQSKLELIKLQLHILRNNSRD